MTSNRNEQGINPDYVMVHPDLQKDMTEKQGQIGFVTVANMHSDDYWVVFDDSQIGLYAADALLVVKKKEEIQEFLIEHQDTLTPESREVLENIVLLNSYGNDDQKKKALEMAAAQPGIRDAVLATVESYNEQSRQQGLER